MGGADRSCYRHARPESPAWIPTERVSGVNPSTERPDRREVVVDRPRLQSFLSLIPTLTQPNLVGMEQCGTKCLEWPFLPPPAIEGPEGGLVDPVRTRRFVCLTKEQVMIERRLKMHDRHLAQAEAFSGFLIPPRSHAAAWALATHHQASPRTSSTVLLSSRFGMVAIRILQSDYFVKGSLFYEVVVQHLTFVHKTTIHILYGQMTRLTQTANRT